jgi:hypothetical protein
MEATLVRVMNILLMIVKEDLGKEKGTSCKIFLRVVWGKVKHMFALLVGNIVMTHVIIQE